MTGSPGVGFRVRTRIQRPSHGLVQAYRELETTNLADAMYGMGAMDGGIRPLLPMRGAVAGPAVTCSVSSGNGLMVRKAIELTRPGDVLVVNGFGNLQRAVVGGNVLMSAAARQVAALVLDGAVRDLEEAGKVGLPVFARGTVARAGTDNLGRGEVNFPVACGGVAVMPGDLVVCDSDGVVVVPRADAQAMLPVAREVQRQKGSAADFEARWQAARSGATGSVDPVLREQGCVVAE